MSGDKDREEQQREDIDSTGDGMAMQEPAGFPFRVSGRGRIWRPSTDIIETVEAIVITVEVAGMEEEDFSIAVTDQMLFISGVRRASRERVVYRQMEIPTGEFSTEVHIGAAIERQGIEASYNNGFLEVILPKNHCSEGT
jgi:HSP20 family molecular chaperone IbpA